QSCGSFSPSPSMGMYSHLDAQSAEELECKICYCAYNLVNRRPKLLECCHSLCLKCLTKIVDLGESPLNALVCPFCRDVTTLPGEAVSSLPDDYNLVAVVALQSRNHRNLHFNRDVTTELLLNPQRLSSLMSSNPPMLSPNFVVITIMEPPPASSFSQDQNLPQHSYNSHTSNQGYYTTSLDSLTQTWTVWNCAALLCQTSARVLVWVLGLLYFSSLPMGVYLLIMQRTTVGVLLVSLVPASLVIIMVYGFCQCVCHELWDSRAAA
uniref:E3 ubiquitin-protein ligase RNF182 n=1 Tax=Gouania willdenowi TaxID=441366 RepID=A0A8C5GLX4_GOUWI